MSSPLQLLARRALPSPPSSSRSLVPTRAFSSSPASQLARMTLIGRLTKDAEVRPTHAGKDAVRYTVATSYGPKDNRRTNFWNIMYFVENEGRKEFMANLSKGSLVAVEGEASLRHSEDSEGRKRSDLLIIQRSVEVLKRIRSAPSEEGAAAEGEGAEEGASQAG